MFDNLQHSTICYLSSLVGARLKEFNCNTSHVNCILVNGNQNTLFRPVLSLLHNKSQQDFNHIKHQLLQLIVQYITNPTIIATLITVQYNSRQNMVKWRRQFLGVTMHVKSNTISISNKQVITTRCRMKYKNKHIVLCWRTLKIKD